jgi:hypothetical protein
MTGHCMILTYRKCPEQGNPQGQTVGQGFPGTEDGGQAE